MTAASATVHRTALVTGATGFLGSCVSAALLEKDIEVIGLSRGQLTASEKLTSSPSFHLVKADLQDLSAYRHELPSVDAVFHFAGTQPPALSSGDPISSVDPGVKATLAFFLACEEAGVKQITFPSTGGSIYGSVSSGSASEDRLPFPESPYAIEKLALEHFLRFISKRSGIDTRVFRISNPYGPSQVGTRHHGVVARFVDLALAGDVLNIYGDGEERRDYIHAEDVARVVVDTSSRPARHDVYNLGTGVSTSLDQLVGTIEKVLGTHLEINKTQIRAGDVSDVSLDVSRIEADFGPLDLTDIEAGIVSVVEARKGTAS